MGTAVDRFHAEFDRRHPGDRLRLFGEIAAHVVAPRVLYPGSYVDIAPSVFFDDVTYVDVDRRAARFFSAGAEVASLVHSKRRDCRVGGTASLAFHHLDYTGELPLADESFDLLVSLYAGFVSEHCTRLLRPGGHLLVNPSHGDAAMASIDDRYELAAVVDRRDGRYVVRTTHLEGYLIAKRGVAPTREELRALGRGIAYTRTPFAYLFRRLGA